MPQKRTLPTFFLALLLLAGFIPLSADVIALHPLKGSPEEIAYDFYNILVRTLPKAQGSYMAYPIDLQRRSPDVPPGGFPPWICPSASMTGGAPYAITGETFPDPDFPGEHRLRLYLWEMDGRTLLGVDEMIASDRQSCEERLPYFLDWMVSWIDTHKEQIKPIERIVEREVPVEVIVERQVPVEVIVERQVPVEVIVERQIPVEVIVERQVPVEVIVERQVPVEVIIEREVPIYIPVDETGRSQETDTIGYDDDIWSEDEPSGDKWLFLGLRVGSGVSLWYDLIEKNQNPNWPELDTSIFINANAALQVSVNLFRYFQLQAEANFSADINKIEDHRIAEKESFTSLSLSVPVLAKVLLWGGNMKIGVFGGPYFYIPLYQKGSDLLEDRFEYKPRLPGAVFGLSVGWPVGPGFLFLDGRYGRDAHWGKALEKGVFSRNLFKLSVGYEYGLLPKKPLY